MQAGTVETLTAVCINQDNYLGRGEEYVSKLRNMVARNLTVPYEFVCLTDLPRKGWWSKLELFKPGRFTGPVLYLDLDIIITANIDHLVTLAATDKTRLWMRDDFSYSIIQPKKDMDPETRRFLGGPGCCNSSVMLWQGGSQDFAWHCWTNDAERYMREMHGDQNVLTRMLWPEYIGLLPNESIQSYKYGIRMRGEKPAPIVVTHGNPKPHELREDWVKACWQ